MGSVGHTLTGCRSGLGTSIRTLQSCLIYSYICVLSHGRAQWIVGSHFWDFYLPPIDESVLSRGCSRGEESGSLYHADPIGIIDGRGKEVLAPTLLETGPWVTRWFLAMLRPLGWELDGDILLYSVATA
jgi:hypothetical protein